MNTTALLAGIIGSLATVLATKLLELATTAQQHRLALRKETFTRRIRVAERAAARLLRLNAVITDKIVFAEILADGSHAHDEYMKEFRESVQNASTFAARLENGTYPFWLYFDVEEYTVLPDDLLRRYHDSQIALRTAFDRWYDLLPDEEPEGAGWEYEPSALHAAAEELRAAYRAQAGVLREVRQRYREAIAIVKREMRAAWGDHPRSPVTAWP